MSENFIPIVSTTPPPLDDFEDSDDDFTEFATAQNNWIDEGDDFADCPLPEKKETLDSPIKSFIPNGEKFQDFDSEISFSFESKTNNDKHSENHIPSFELAAAQQTYQPNDSDLQFEPKIENEFQSMKIETCDKTYSSNNHFNDTGQRPLFDEQDSNSINSSDVLQSVPNGVQNSASERPNFNELDDQSDSSDLSKEKSDILSNEISHNELENSESPSHSPTIANEINQITEAKSENNSIHEVKLESDSSEESSSECSKSQTDPQNGGNLEIKDSEHFSTPSIDSEGPNSDEFADFSKEPQGDANNTTTEESQPVEEFSTDGNASHFTDFSSNSKPGESPIQPSLEFSPAEDTTSPNHEDSDKFSAFAVTPTLETSKLSDVELPPTEVTKSCEELPADFSDDEFSDFAAMSAVTTRPSEVEMVNTDITAESPADDFSSFPQSSSDAADDDFGAFNTQEDNFGDFGAFDNFQSSSDPTENDDFGDFSSMATDSKVPELEQYQPVQTFEPKTVDIKGCFPINGSTTDINSNLTKAIHCHVDDDLIQTFNSSQEETPAATGPMSTSRPSQLWDLLEDVDNAIALKHQWTNSSHHQHLLAALGINTQNILFGRTSKPYYVPTYYAAYLGLLEPGKEMKPLSAAEKITAMSPTDKNQPSIDGQSKPWTTETGVASNGLANGVLACSGVAGDSGSMPSNGVTLDASSLNLDAFSDSLKSNSQTTAATTEQDKIDPELLELAMDVTPDLSTKRADPLSKILATLRVSSSSKKSSEDEEDLSTDARRVLKKLPQISFMRSKVLMFPVGQSSPVHH